MWWRIAKTSVIKGFGGGVLFKKDPPVDEMQDQGNRIQDAAERANLLRKMNPNEMSIEDKLRSTPNRGGLMHIPPKVNVHQTTESLLELIGDKNKSSFRPDQHEGPWDSQHPMNPDISKNSYPPVPPR